MGFEKASCRTRVGVTSSEVDRSRIASTRKQQSLAMSRLHISNFVLRFQSFRRGRTIRPSQSLSDSKGTRLMSDTIRNILPRLSNWTSGPRGGFALCIKVSVTPLDVLSENYSQQRLYSQLCNSLLYCQLSSSDVSLYRLLHCPQPLDARERFSLKL